MKSMSDERSNHLIQCAMKIASLMNVGVDPDAALEKIARDEALNAEEVKRVSEATNNAKTISVLATSKSSDKCAPFPLTNADKVNEKLWSKNPDAEHDGKEDATGNFDATKLKSKKAAAEASLAKTGSYLGTAKVDHAAVWREACGHDQLVHSRQKLAVDVTEDAEVILRAETESTGTIKVASADHRMVGNPFAALQGARHLRDDARAKFAEDSDAASGMLDDIATSLRRTDAPSFARVEKIASAFGVPTEIIDIVYELGNLSKLGQARADVSVKLADEHDIAHCTPIEKSTALALVDAAAMCKAASDVYSVFLNLEAGLVKAAADLGAAVKHISTEFESLPDRLSGAGYDHAKAVDLIGNATDTMGEKPDLPKGDDSPLDVNTRQELANNDTAMGVQRLMSDSFIGKHPISQVVDAFNRIKSVNPHMADAELNSLVRHDLSTDGGVPFDTLHRARPGSSK